MQKLASEFEKTTIITKQERVILGYLKDVIINPENKKAIGMSLKIAGRKGKEAVFNASDITGVGTNFIMIDSADNISPPDEIIRIKEVLDLEIKLVGSKVIDEDGKHLGKVRDWSVNLKTMYLARIYVVSSSLVKAFAQDLIISGSNIVKIEKNEVIVRGGSVKSKKSEVAIAKNRVPIKAGVAHLIKQKR